VAQSVIRRQAPLPAKPEPEAAAKPTGQAAGEAQVAGAVVAAAAGLQEVVGQPSDAALVKPVAHPGAQGAVALFRVAVFRLFADEALPLAGNIAYRTLLSTFPFLIFLTTLGALFGDAQLAQRTVEFLFSVAPSYVVEPIQREIHNVLSTPQRGLFTVSVLITVWSAMGGVDSVRVCLNRAYDIKENRTPWQIWLLSLVMVFAGAIGLLAVAVLIVAAPVALDVLRQLAPESDMLTRRIDIVRYPVAVFLLATMLLAFHLVLPAGRRRVREVWPGVLFTLVAWGAMAGIYGYYLRWFPNFATTYAGLSGIVAALFFLYLAAIVLIFGGELNRVLMLRREARAIKAMIRKGASKSAPSP
jgi:membrane protein